MRRLLVETTSEGIHPHAQSWTRCVAASNCMWSRPALAVLHFEAASFLPLLSNICLVLRLGVNAGMLPTLPPPPDLALPPLIVCLVQTLVACSFSTVDQIPRGFMLLRSTEFFLSGLVFSQLLRRCSSSPIPCSAICIPTLVSPVLSLISIQPASDSLEGQGFRTLPFSLSLPAALRKNERQSRRTSGPLPRSSNFSAARHFTG